MLKICPIPNNTLLPSIKYHSQEPCEGIHYNYYYYYYYYYYYFYYQHASSTLRTR